MRLVSQAGGDTGPLKTNKNGKLNMHTMDIYNTDAYLLNLRAVSDRTQTHIVAVQTLLHQKTVHAQT